MVIKDLIIILFLTIKEAIAFFCKVYSIILSFRLTMTWFPNFNPFMQPFYLLTRITDPYLRLFKGVLPSVLGIDFSPILALLWLQCLSDIVKPPMPL